MGRLIAWLLRSFSQPKDPTLKKLRQAIQAMANLRPNNIAVYKLALQHSSVKETPHSNERLEFLGDAVLSLVIGDFLFKKYPYQEEGFLTEMRSRIVNRHALTELAKKIGIDILLTYDTRSIKTNNHTKFIYGNALEAFIGAIYIDHGYSVCARFIIDKLLKNHISLDTILLSDTNYKSRIITWAQKNKKQLTFQLATEQFTAGEKEFVIHLLVDGNVYGEGIGKTKKQAEQQAAQATLSKLPIIPDTTA